MPVECGGQGGCRLLRMSGALTPRCILAAPSLAGNSPEDTFSSIVRYTAKRSEGAHFGSKRGRCWTSGSHRPRGVPSHAKAMFLACASSSKAKMCPCNGASAWPAGHLHAGAGRPPHAEAWLLLTCRVQWGSSCCDRVRQLSMLSGYLTILLPRRYPFLTNTLGVLSSFGSEQVIGHLYNYPVRERPPLAMPVPVC